MFNRKLVDAIQRCNILIERIKDDCAVQTDKFDGDTANILNTIRQNELNRIMETFKLLNELLEER